MSASIALQTLRIHLKKNRHRALLVLSGSLEWQTAQLAALWQASESLLWAGKIPREFTDHAKQIKEAQYKHLLGQEVDSVVIDSRAGFSANGLGILSGLIRAGGLLVFLTEDKSKWTGLPNLENQRFLSTPYLPESAFPFFSEHLEACFTQNALWLSEDDAEERTLNRIDDFTFNLPPIDSEQTLPTDDQQQALQRIHKVGFGHRKRPLVLSADRGRGKTTVLGLSAIDLLTHGKQHIVLTASRYDQASTAFEQACSLLKREFSDCRILTNKTGLLTFECQNQTKVFEFIAPDQLILQPTLADVLMVDEAAHLPTPLLTELLKRHHRMVFATTLHGYEGSGRGFELRFKKTLNELTPDWKNRHLNTPIRWAENDPLETVINQALLLNTQLEPTQSTQKLSQQSDLDSPLDLSTLQLHELSTQSLAADPEQLQSVFNLLVHAHYQTTPNDLQQLLSAPNLKLFIAQANQQILGVVLCIEEGKIQSKKTHLHGHLVPQLLVSHYTQPSFLMLSTWRVMRIAVHPHFQNSGIGKQLLTFIKQAAKQARIDYLSSSFGATDELLSFWFQQGFIPLHVGVKRDKASGSHNIVVGQSLSAMAQQALAGIQREFQAQFPHILMESLPYLSASMVLAIHQTFRYKNQPHQLQQALLDYEAEQRAYESISGQLWKWSIRNPNTINQASELQRSVWCDKVLKKRPWQEVAHTYHLAGRKGVEKVLKELITQTIKNPSQVSEPYARVLKAY